MDARRWAGFRSGRGMACVLALAAASLIAAAACGSKSTPPTSPSPQPVTTTGTVVDILAGTGVPGVTVAFPAGGATGGTSNASGSFSVQSSTSGTWSAKLTGGTIVDRAVALKVPGPDAVVSVIPSSFNLAAFNQMFRPNGSLQRWVAAPPVVVLRRTLVYTAYSDNTFVASTEELSQADAEAIVADLAAGFAQLTGGTLGTLSSVTYEDVQPGASTTVARQTAIVVGRYKGLTAGSGYWGYGRWATNGANEVVGGIVMLDHDFDTSSSRYRRSLRIHELGHALGYMHVTLCQSAMNASAVNEPNDWDRQAVSIAFKRPPGNTTPDTDPMGVSANQARRRITWGPITP